MERNNLIYSKILGHKKRGIKSFAVLLDPDNLNKESCIATVRLGIENQIDYFLVGGSLITTNKLTAVLKIIKSLTTTPVIIFPGAAQQINPLADGILLLSLISGRNPELLIGSHVTAAPTLKRSKLEILATGYMLIDCGRPTAVSYMSNTTPIPYNKPAIASCTAMAGEMLGLSLIYLDGGSGAEMPVSVKMIGAVKKACSLPLIVGGGINTPQKAHIALSAGADIIVIGNAIEKNRQLLPAVSEMINELNIH